MFYFFDKRLNAAVTNNEEYIKMLIILRYVDYIDF